MSEKSENQLKSLKNPLKHARLSIILLISIITNCFGQSITWDRTYLQSIATTGKSVKQTTDGNYIVTGGRYNYGGFISKLNPLGDTLWTRYTPYTQMHSIVESPDGNYVAIGYDYYLYITKYSPSGSQIWAKEIEEPGYDIYAYNIINTNDSCFLVCGLTRFGIPSVRSAYYTKIDQYGTKLWSKMITVQNAILGLRNSFQTNDNGYILIGGKTINDNGDFLLVKINSLGDTVWTRNFGSQIFDYGLSVFQTYDNGFLAFGNIEYSNQNIKLYFLKTDSLGNLQWSKIYGDTNTFYQMLYGENAIKSKYDNSFYVTGFSTDLPIGDTNKIFLLKIDESGNRLWDKFYKKDTLHLRGFAIDQTSDSGFVISGDAFDSPVITNTLSDPQYLYVLKLDKNGILNPIGINNDQQIIPKSFQILNVYPNPFNPVTNILIEMNKREYLTVKIYNILGKEVQVLTKKYYDFGKHIIRFDGTIYPSGIYFIAITTNKEQKEVRSVILIK